MPAATNYIAIRERTLDVAYTAALGVRAILRLVLRPTEIGVRALVVRGDEVLLVRHRSGREPWALPGGGVNGREPLEEAAQREALEEAGCPIKIERLHGMFHYFGRGMRNFTAVYICTPLAEPQPPVGDLEIATARFVHTAELPPDTERGTLRRIREYQDGAGGLSGEW